MALLALDYEAVLEHMHAAHSSPLPPHCIAACCWGDNTLSTDPKKFDHRPYCAHLNVYLCCAHVVINQFFGHAAMTAEMSRDLNIWQARPMSPAMLQYTAEDVSQLLLLADKLSGDLGGAELRVLPKLSMAYAQWHWDAADRDGAQPDSHRYVTGYSRTQLVVIVSVCVLGVEFMYYAV